MEASLVGKTVDADFQFLHKVVRHENEEQVEIGTDLGVAENLVIYSSIVLDQRCASLRDGAWTDTIVSQGFLNAISDSTLLQNREEESPVLTLAESRHEELSILRSVVHGCRTAYLIVVPQTAVRYLSWSVDDTHHFAFGVATQIGGITQTAILFLHEGHLTFEFVGSPAIVTVTESDVASFSLLDGDVAGETRSVVGIEEEETHTTVLLLKLEQTVAHFGIGRSIVGDEEFEIGIGLRQNGTYAVNEKLALVVGRHDYRHLILDGLRVLLHGKYRNGAQKYGFYYY